MRSSRNSGAAFLAAALVAVTVSGVSAHRRDEYLQAARIAIDPDRIEIQLDLTPGIALANRVIAEIDRDRDGVVSEQETRAYASVVERDIRLELDGRALPVVLLDSRSAAASAMANGEGTLQLRWSAEVARPGGGTHRLVFRNSHRTDISVYLANVLVPSNERVAVAAQDRDVDQRQFVVSYRLEPPSKARPAMLLLVLGGLMAGGATLWSRRHASSRVVLTPP